MKVFVPLLGLDFGREMGYGNNPYFSFYFTFVLQSVSACAGDLSMLHNQFEISVVTEKQEVMGIPVLMTTLLP